MRTEEEEGGGVGASVRAAGRELRRPGRGKRGCGVAGCGVGCGDLLLSVSFFSGWICFAGCLGTEGLEGHSRLFFFVMAVLTNGVFVAGM